MNAFIIYNLILLFVCFFSLIYCTAKNSGIKTLLFGMVLMIILIPSSLRFNIGTDVLTYRFIFNNLDYFKEKTEIGYYFLNFFVKTCGLSFQWVLVLSALMSYYFALKSFKKDYFFVYAVFFVLVMYLPSYSMIRQFLAICIIMYGLSTLTDKSKWTYLVVVSGACLFHSSALIMFFFIFIRKVKLTATLAFFIIIVFTIVIYYFNAVNMLFESSFFQQSKYGVYALNEFGRKTELGTGIGIFLRLLVPVYVIINAKKIYNNESCSPQIVILSLIYICTLLLSANVYIFNRLVDLFMYIPILGVVEILRISKAGYSKVITGGLCFIIYLLLFELTISNSAVGASGGLGINPYLNVFDRGAF